MFTKILFAVALTAVVAQDHQHKGNDHGHAYSSQSFVLHKSQSASAHQESDHHYEESHQGNHEHYVENHRAEEQYHGHHGVTSENIKLYNDGHVSKHVEYYGHPKYDFAYEVKDPHTHDHKYQHESRDGDRVKGVYSLDQPDGTVRVVKYYADKKSGFNADVKYEGHAVHVVPEHKHHHH